jgi:hypothetical protein
MKFDSDDALDRALFALPLEEAPSDLRSSILTATIYRTAPIFKPWETIALATIAAVVVWLVVLVAQGGATLFLHSLQTIGSTTARSIGNTTTLVWLAAGGGTAIWLSLFTGFQPSAKGVAARNR